MRFQFSTKGEALLALSISVVLGALAVNRYAPSTMHADTILHSIMSLQHVTPFYWGQNRFANIVALLLSPVSAPLLNLGLHLLMFATAYYAFLIALTLSVAKHALGVTNGQDRWLAVALVLAICTLLISPRSAAVFIIEGQPYALSYLAMVAAVWFARGEHYASASLSQLAILVSVGLNPSVVLLAGPLAIVFYFLRRYREGTLIFAGTILSFVVWHILSTTAPNPGIGYAEFQFGAIQEDLLTAARSILSAFTILNLVGCIFVLLAIIMVSKSSDQTGGWRLLPLLIALMALAWWGLFGVSAWVKANISHFRYFFPTILAICLLLTIFLYKRILTTSPIIKRATFFICMFISVFALLAAPARLRNYAVIEKTATYADYASRNGITLIAGDYWLVWPVVYQLLYNRHVAFGITSRGEGNVASIREWVDSQPNRHDLKAMCVGSEIPVCTDKLRSLTGREWSTSPSPCDIAKCVVLTNQK